MKNENPQKNAWVGCLRPARQETQKEYAVPHNHEEQNRLCLAFFWAEKALLNKIPGQEPKTITGDEMTLEEFMGLEEQLLSEPVLYPTLENEIRHTTTRFFAHFKNALACVTTEPEQTRGHVLSTLSM
ncbi:MAG: hypothetical protein IT558_06385 [Alphaproteobacteria bacterium]|nr:hypothetical protein [Alphaproteobacteria bacterium]